MPRGVTTYPAAQPAFELARLTGAVELRLAEAVAAARARPAKVTGVLAALLRRLDGQVAAAETLRSLASGTREWLLQRAAARFRPAQDWLSADCQVCGTRYDLALDIAALPMKPAGAGFPTVAVETSLGQRLFEAPNGTHETAVARQRLTGEAARRHLAALCGLDADSRAAAERFDAEDLERIDAALEALSPEAVSTLASRCPNCEAETQAWLDPLDYAFPRLEPLLREVHRIAANYHWSEAEILALPTARRRRYLALIGSRP